MFSQHWGIGANIDVRLASFPLPRDPLPQKQLVHSIETVVIDWCHQVRDVLKKTSAQALLDGNNPGPTTEIDFWKARWDDLESIVEQVCVLCILYYQLSEGA